MDAKFKLAGLTILGLFIKWVVLKWATQKFVNIFDWVIKKLLGDKPEELAIWMHYRKRRANQGHQYPNPLRCEDGDCQRVHLY
jgi:hypothetical protein